MAKKKVQEPMAGAPFSPYRKLTVAARKGSGAATADEVKRGYRVTLGRGGKVKPK